MADFNPDQTPGTHVKDVHDNEDSKLAEWEIRFGAFLSIVTIVARLIIFQKLRHRIHDLVADTMVIKA